MKTFLPTVLLLFALCGCANDTLIQGEVFTNLPQGTGVAKQAGVMVHFLSPDEKREFDKIVTGYRSSLYKRDRQTWNAHVEEYNAILKKHKKSDGTVDNAEAIGQLRNLEYLIIQPKANIEGQLHEGKLPLGIEEAKNLLQKTKQTQTDSEGKFSIRLTLGSEYWVVAGSWGPSFSKWYFRHVPDGAKLVLSDGNSL